MKAVRRCRTKSALPIFYVGQPYTAPVANTEEATLTPMTALPMNFQHSLLNRGNMNKAGLAISFSFGLKKMRHVLVFIDLTIKIVVASPPNLGIGVMHHCPAYI